MNKIGIVGQGYVGTAVKTIFKQYYDVLTYDIKNIISNTSSLEELVNKTNIIFVCVPTPMNEDRSCNTSIVEDVISNINDLVKMNKLNHIDDSDKIVVIKSTVTPGTTDRLNIENDSLSVIFNPEFLTEANFIDDFKNQNRIILGGKRPGTTKVKQVYSKVLPNAKIIKTGSTHAEMVKYMTNAFLATKVSFANEINLICDKLNVDYDKVVEYATYDSRLGKSHWDVPGPDTHYGFGGSCFPKDINALIHLAAELNIPLNTIPAVWDTNILVRPEEDWKELKGRAVTK
jgi:UDPglucose 6-dehydrogenase